MRNLMVAHYERPGRRRMVMSKITPITVEATLNAPVSRVWQAITDDEEMRRWFFETIKAFEAMEGFETEFNVHNEGRDYPHHWKVTKVVAGQKLVYDWTHPGVVGTSFVEWDLVPSGDGTRLTLTHTGIETFPADDPAFRPESCHAGWKYFLT